MPRRLTRLAYSRWFLLAGYLLLAGIAVGPAVVPQSAPRSVDPYTHYNNYVIFRQSFAHLVGQQELYTLSISAEHWDYFRYSPSFALAFGAFAWMPDLAGLLLWNILNVSVLFAGLEDAAGPRRAHPARRRVVRRDRGDDGAAEFPEQRPASPGC